MCSFYVSVENGGTLMIRIATLKDFTKQYNFSDFHKSRDICPWDTFVKILHTEKIQTFSFTYNILLI